MTGQEPHDGCPGGYGAGSVVARSKLLATTPPSADTKLTSGYPVNVHDREAVLIREKYCDSVPACPKVEPTPSFNWVARQDEAATAVVEVVGATARRPFEHDPAAMLTPTTISKRQKRTRLMYPETETPSTDTAQCAVLSGVRGADAAFPTCSVSPGRVSPIAGCGRQVRLPARSVASRCRATAHRAVVRCGPAKPNLRRELLPAGRAGGYREEARRDSCTTRAGNR